MKYKRSVEQQVNSCFFETLPTPSEELVAPKFPRSLLEVTGKFTPEQEEVYKRFCADRDGYRSRRLLIEICLKEEELFPPANFDLWTKKDLWRPVEFAALLLGAAPEELKLELVYEQRNSLPKAHTLCQTLELLASAVLAGVLKDGDRPARFVRWARSKKMSLPDELLALAQANANSVAEDDADNHIETLRGECRALREEVARLTAENQRWRNKKRPPTPRPETKDLVLLGCAMELRFDPSARSNPAIKQIQNGVAKAGYQIDDGTILNVLRHARELKRSS